MISVDIEGYRFQFRAAAVVVHEGFVLLHRGESDEFWALPGGRVEPGEASSSTIRREMAEELNESVECGELLFAVENFFVHASKRNHEVGLYYRTWLQATSTLLDKSRSHAGVEGASHLEFRWFAIERLGEVDLQPSFLRESLSRPVLSFQHIVQQG